MANIEEAKKAVVEFLKKTLNVKDVKVIKAAKAGDGWESEAEVYEESSFIKSLGLPTRVQDRNIYSIKLNDDLEVQSYERKEQLRSGRIIFCMGDNMDTVAVKKNFSICIVLQRITPHPIILKI